MNLLKRMVADAAQRMGYTIIPSWRLHSGPQTTYLKKLLDYAEIDAVIDVGANIGQYYRYLRSEVGFRGAVVSIEPIPSHVESMRASAADPQWTIVQAALGAEAGEAKFNVMRSTEFSSLRQPEHSETGLFMGDNRISETIAVNVQTLDGLSDEIESLSKARSIYLKLDTQGFDLEVLRGASRTLSRISALQTEASVKSLYKGAPKYIETIQSIESKGYLLSGIYPNNEGHFPVLIEFDCYFVSARLMPASHLGVVDYS